MAQDLPLSPTASGRLSATPLPELLVLSLERRISGSFVFTAPARRESTVVVASGRVVKVRPPEPVELLGTLLQQAGAVDHGVLEHALRLAKQGPGRLGEILLGLDAVDRATLERVSSEQLGRRLARIGRLPGETTFTFYADIDLLDDEPGCAGDPLSLVWRCLREGGSPERQQSLLGELADRPLRLRSNGAIERLELSAAERSWLAVLHAGPLPLQALLATAVELDAAAARQLVYALVVTRQLVVAASLDSARPDARASGVSARDGSSAPHVSLPPAAGSSEPAPPARRSPADRRRTDAPESVEHALERASRLVRERARAEGAAEAARAIEAAQTCIARKQFSEAAQLARKACDADPGNPEHLALHAWLRMQNGELSVPHLAAQIMSAFDRAALKAPASVSIRFYRAQALKRLGRDEEAYRDFRFVARRAPDHIDAVREVRLHMMRTRNEQKQSGVFAKLFSR
jgi:tetratricopeptide (TPR) repeat protein